MAAIAMSRQAKAAIRALRKNGAPDDLISKFRELLSINKQCAFAASMRDLMLDACKSTNFSAVFAADGVRREFRARLLDPEHPEYAEDCFDYRSSRPHLGREQDYRRGYDQGFAEARRLVEKGSVLEDIKQREEKIHRWRVRPIQIPGSAPGSDEQYDQCFVIPRGGISARTRYNIFKRDDFRCQICGKSQRDGITLHVDHKRSIAGGGDDDPDNLQTLCSDCNLGKSSDSMC